MPARLQTDENLLFLYNCLQHSNMTSIDFAAVGEAHAIKPSAARMRYNRLRDRINPSPRPPVPHNSKGNTPRKRPEKEKVEVGVKREREEADGGESDDDEMPLAKRRKLQAESLTTPASVPTSFEHPWTAPLNRVSGSDRGLYTLPQFGPVHYGMEMARISDHEKGKQTLDHWTSGTIAEEAAWNHGQVGSTSSRTAEERKYSC